VPDAATNGQQPLNQNRLNVTAIGMVSWDSLLVVDEYPHEGGWTSVTSEASLPGGTTANSAAAATVLGASVKLFGAVGTDDTGDELVQSLRVKGIDTANILKLRQKSTDRTTLLVSTRTSERTIFWHRGARLTLGSPLNILDLFASNICLIDTDDYDLTRFLVDLPVHTSPVIRLVGTLSYLPDAHASDIIETLLGFDCIVGSKHDLGVIIGADNENQAITRLQELMVGSNLRSAFLTDGKLGSCAVDRASTVEVSAIPVQSVDTTGAGDAFAGAVVFGLGNRWGLEDILYLANAVGALATMDYGAQTALPSLAEARSLLGQSQ
jgi:ribokinase